jgi:hypothetical protein
MNDPLSLAQSERDRKRARFRSSLAEAKARLNPKTIASDGVVTARTRIVDTVRKRPGMVAGLVSAVALIALRKPIFGALARLTKEKDHG